MDCSVRNPDADVTPRDAGARGAGGSVTTSGVTAGPDKGHNDAKNGAGGKRSQNCNDLSGPDDHATASNDGR